MVRQIVMAFACVYTVAMRGVPLEPIHVYLSVPGVWKQYTGLHYWTSTCFLYIHVHGSSLLTITTVFLQPGVYKVYISMNSLFFKISLFS